MTTTAGPRTGSIESAFRARRAAGTKLLVPYVMAGLSDDWTDVVHAVVAAGADAVEIGIPFSDPMMDGPVIQEAAVPPWPGGPPRPGCSPSSRRPGWASRWPS